MKKKLKITGVTLLAALIIFTIIWIIKTRLNAPSEEQLKKEKAQDDTTYQGDGGKIDDLDKLVSDESDSLATDTLNIN